MSYGDYYDNYEKYRNPTVLTLSEKPDDYLGLGVSTGFQMGTIQSTGIKKITSTEPYTESERVSGTPTDGLLFQGKLMLDAIDVSGPGKVSIGPLFGYASFSDKDSSGEPARGSEASGTRLGGSLEASWFFDDTCDGCTRRPIGVMFGLLYETILSGLYQGSTLGGGTLGLNFRSSYLIFGPWFQLTFTGEGSGIGAKGMTEATFGLNIQSPTLVF